MSDMFCGIDFGTTRSAAVGYIDGRAISFGDDEGRPIPSLVAIDKNTGEVSVGIEAWEQKNHLSNSCIVIPSIKTILDSDNTFSIANREWTSTDIASEIFKHLKQIAHARSGVDMDKAVLAIPVGFSRKKRARLREAAKYAGIDVISFVSEPTAAFFANYDDLKSSSNVAIFDWGGGTLDISILEHAGGKVSELMTIGWGVAGDDLDDKLARRLHASVEKKLAQQISYDDMLSSSKDMILMRAERAKRAFSDDDTHIVSVNKYIDDKSFNIPLEYSWFSLLFKTEIDHAIKLLDDAIARSGVGLQNIDRVVMVGGSSNLRPLIEKMEEKYGDKLYFPEETMWNVAQGAAILSRKPGRYHSNQSIGLILSDGTYHEILPKDTLLNGWKYKCSFGLVDTSSVARFIFSGSADIDTSQERYKTLSIPTYGFLEEAIDLHALVDEDMIFRVSGKSAMHTNDFGRIWEYPELKCYYLL